MLNLVFFYFHLAFKTLHLKRILILRKIKMHADIYDEST